MSNTRSSRIRTVVSLVVSLLLIGAALWLFMNRQFVADAAANIAYAKDPRIEAIAERTGLTQSAEFALYATHPELLERDEFNSVCPRREVASPILGCYSSQDRIYVYNVTDDRLDGMKEVTTVHELLHAIWFRSSPEQKQQLEAWLRAAYERRGDDALRERMDYYQRNDPGEFVNELYAILGTEVSDLGPELEAHYAQYFDRAKVVALHAKYNDRYQELRTNSVTLVTQMDALSAQIDSESASYEAAAAAYSAQVADFNQRAESGVFTSIGAFNTERSQLLQQASQLDAARESINQKIAQHNVYYEQYQAIVSEIDVLNRGMDSYETIEQTPGV